jgi:hypothetical protein
MCALQVQEVQRPAYCEEQAVMAMLQAEASKPLSYDMHPCNFLHPSRAPVLPHWGPDLWSVMHEIREKNRRLSYMSGVHRAP